MKIFIPAWHYRARAIVQKTWGWSPIEEMTLLSMDSDPGTMAEIAARLSVPLQVARATVSRLMQFGLIELRISPEPAFTTSAIGRDLIRAGKPLPERTSEREIHISVVLEKVGHSLFRRKEVTLVPVYGYEFDGRVVSFPPDELPETDETMVHRITQFVPLRPGEWLRGIRTTSSVIERKFLEIDLQAYSEGKVPDGASEDLQSALNETLRTTQLPRASQQEAQKSSSLRTVFGTDQLVVGSTEHIERFEHIVGNACSDVFVLSTFVASQDDEKGRVRRERIYRSLEAACARGVQVHLFFGTSIDKKKHGLAMQELIARLSAIRGGTVFLLAQRDSVGSHAKFVVADDGQGGAVALVGSCNWLSSPFAALEVSAELREPTAVAAAIDLLRGIVVSLPTASRSVEILQFLAAALRRNGRMRPVELESMDRATATLTILQAHEHEQLLRNAAHRAEKRFVCITNRMGVTVVPGLLNPAEVAGRRLEDVRVFYSRRSKAIKRGHMTAHRNRLEGVVEIIPVLEPQVHAKFLAWDDDHVVVSTLNWGSQSGVETNPLDEVGFYIRAPGIAQALLTLFDEALKAVIE
ncbi:phospholipase D-like domain-containing protein [Pelagibacterium lentulum]|uniref:Phospholipase D n=1 Tax=Pelagibacterium lentulum TaxID=2029865 RepID=A0A916RRA4_9HYPH|nr:phospholipase D-like domain-containing protein [Pelagibacterium lentulum]GGA65282.1 hypothetical protein GCM10011499_39670 [Pelagibacterium lentulum]